MRTEPREPNAPDPPDGRTAEAILGGIGSSESEVRFRDGLLDCLKVFLSVRVLMSVIALVAVAVLPNLSLLHGPADYALPGPVSVPGWPAHAITPGWHNLVTAWERFDALWFLRIAAHGYTGGDGSAAFFPLYPTAIRILSFVLGGHPLAAALLISNASFFGSLVVLHALTRREFGSQELARRTVLYAAVFPTAFFFLAPYSESPFLLLVLLTFWWARGRRWALAGLAGTLAALTRNLGVILVLPLALEAMLQYRDDRRSAPPGGRHRSAGPTGRFPVWPLAWSLAPVAGLGLYVWYWYDRSGDWLAFVHQQANWERMLVSPLTALAQGTHVALQWIGIYPGGYHLIDWLIAVPVLVAAVAALVWFRPTYGLYVWASALVPLAFIFHGRPLMSFPRFALALFPVFWAMARWTERSRLRHEVVLVASASLLGVLLVLFVNWYYIF